MALSFHSIKSLLTNLWHDGPRVALENTLYRATVRWYEWRLGISTEGVVSADELGLKNEQYFCYAPTNYRSLKIALAAIQVTSSDVFLDLGSGMGRVVIMASTLPFRRVIGVDISPELNSIARRNVESARSRLKCHTIDIFTADATAFEIPPDVSIIYCCNSFVLDALVSVAKNIRQSLCNTPRDLKLIGIVPANSRFKDDLEREVCLKLDCDIFLSDDSRCKIFSVTAHRVR
jgi:SAM-dependent methyltransferase